MIEDYIIKLGKINPEQKAIILGNDILSYGELSKMIEEMYNYLSNSIDRKKVVMIHGDYSFNAIALTFALCKLDCVIIPIVTTNKIEIEKRIEVAGPDYIIASKDLSLVLVDDHSKEKKTLYKDLFDSDKSGLVLFSSGSTGEPKAMVHDMDNLIRTYITNKSKQLTFIVFLMFDHIGGLNTMLNVLSMGSTMIIPEKREPELIGELIQKYNVNVLPASPTFLNMMSISGVLDVYDFSSLKLVTYGTEPMAERLLRTLKEKLPRTRLVQTFGTSETGIIKTKSKSSTSLLMKFDDKNQEIRIVNNELWIRSKTRVLGYLNDSGQSFDKDGWFKTGDLVEEKEDGYYRIVGRKSEIINVGGEKVLPGEVENVILELDYIQDCVVFAKESPIVGQVVAARVVLTSDFQEIDNVKRLIRAYCREKLERYKVPAVVIVADSLEYSSRFKKKRK